MFISYSHDSAPHKERVLELARALLEAGWDVRLDRYAGHPAEGWPRWMARQLREADRVVCVCTPTYRRRFDGEEKAGGLGVSWEGHLITADLYSARGAAVRYIPAFLDAADDVPLALRPHAIEFETVGAHLGPAGAPRSEPPIGGGAEGTPPFAPVRGLFRTLRMHDGQYAPSDLLRAEFGAVGHIPRPGLDDDLDAWCGGGGVRIRLMTGAGGSGKTRSALELARRRQREGWRVGPLVESEASPEALASLFEDPIPLLLIVDYAELRTPELARVLGYLDEAVETARQPMVVRVLLLARSKGKWWDNLAQAAECLGRYADGFDWRVPPLRSDTFGRHAAERYAVLLARPLPPSIPEDGPTPLERQVDALLTVYGDAARGLDALMRHEDKFIERAATRKVGNATLLQGSVVDLLPRAIALATLVGGFEGSEAPEWLAAVPGLGDLTEHEREAVFNVLSRLYPDGNGGIAPLRPDRLGERLVFREVKDDLQATLLALAVDRGRGPRALTVLTRLARSAQHEIGAEETELLTRLLRLRLGTTARDALDVAVQTGDPIGRILAAELDLHPEPSLVQQLHAALPNASVALRELAEVCTRHVAEREADPEARARHLVNLSNRLADLGRREDALAVAVEAVQVYRAFSRARPDSLVPNLAKSLNNLSSRLADLGRREEALAAIEEAMQVARALARARPDAFLPNLASSLTNLSVMLAGIGRPEDAVAAAEEAVEVRRELARARPDAFLPNLTMALTNLSGIFAVLGRRESALAAIEEAVTILRPLVRVRRDAFLPDLARALNNQSVMLADLGRFEHSLAAIEEAGQVYRALASARPDAFLPDFARSMNNLSLRLADFGRLEGSLAAIEEAVLVYRALASARPDAFLPDLALAMNNLAVSLSGLGRREDALAAIEEAVQLRRALARARPDAFLPDLGGSLNNLALRLGDLGRREDALVAVEEAVQVYRALASARPDAFLPELASSLNNRSVRLADLGRREEALAAIEEAMMLYRTLARARPDAFRRDIAMALNNLSWRLADFGRREQALAAIEEAVQVYRLLASARPDAFLPHLATSLSSLSGRLANLGRHKDALAAIEEAVQLRRALAHVSPDAFLPELSGSLNNLSLRLAGVGRREDALAAIEEAVQLHRALARAQPEAFLPNLACSLNNLSNWLAAVGRREDALAAIEEAVRLRRALARARPDAFLPDLATSLWARALLASDTPDPDGINAGGEAVSLFVVLARNRPDAFAKRLDACRQTYAAACATAGIEPDTNLIKS